MLDLDLVLEELEQSRERLVASWQRANKASIEADGKMQSRYDTQKEEYAAEASMIQAQIDRADSLIECLENLRRPEDVDQVQIGHVVQVQIENDEPMTVLLLEKLGGNILGGIQLVSVQSPIGKAILGRKVNETVMYQVPAGEVVVQILGIA